MYGSLAEQRICRYLQYWPAELNGEPSEIRKIRYEASQDDSLRRIAEKFRVRMGDITHRNKIFPQRYLHPGQALTRFIEVVCD